MVKYPVKLSERCSNQGDCFHCIHEVQTNVQVRRAEWYWDFISKADKSIRWNLSKQDVLDLFEVTSSDSECYTGMHNSAFPSTLVSSTFHCSSGSRMSGRNLVVQSLINREHCDPEIRYVHPLFRGQKWALWTQHRWAWLYQCTLPYRLWDTKREPRRIKKLTVDDMLLGGTDRRCKLTITNPWTMSLGCQQTNSNGRVKTRLSST